MQWKMYRCGQQECVGRRNPLVSLQFEIDMLPVKWEALWRGIEFWVQVMRMNDERLVKSGNAGSLGDWK